jgi:hypothetical protein
MRLNTTVTRDDTEVRSGSKAALRAPTSNFRFAPDSGLKSDIAPCLKSANNGPVLSFGNSSLQTFERGSTRLVYKQVRLAR